MMHWAEQYIGHSWVKGGNGPDVWNCWNFVRHIQKTHFGIVMPEVNADEDSTLSFVREFSRNAEHEFWSELATPQEGDCVEMGTGKTITHIGVWVEADGGGVLHCQRGAGVVYTAAHLLRVQWPLVRFWRRHAG